MEYYDPWDWNVPTEDSIPAYQKYRRNVLQKHVSKKHLVNMLTLHKYRNPFRSWVPFYHSWIDPFDRRWATKSNKWPSNVNIKTLRVDLGVRAGYTNLSRVREFLLFEVKPFLDKQQPFSFHSQFIGFSKVAKVLALTHKSHNHYLIYKNFHKKRLRKKYEYISMLT